MIIDASVAFKWLVEEPGSEEAISWIGRVDLRAPTLVLIETGNALTKRVRLKELQPDGLGETHARLARMLTLVDEVRYIPRAIELSLQLSHSLYDCVYAAMAEGLGDHLLTADKPFAEKLIEAGMGASIVLLGAND